MSERAAPFYCPYCGEEHLVPLEEAGAWFCQDCVRSFKLSFLGVGNPTPPAHPAPGKENSP